MPEQAEAWTASGFATPAAATEWTDIGIVKPVVAEQWSAAGFTATTARGWLEIDDITPDEAATCANGGLKPADVERIRRADSAFAITDVEQRRRTTQELDINV